MFTDPEIVSSDDLSVRSYVKVYIDGKRHRFYNGKLLNLNCNPNHCKNHRERNRALSALSFELKQKLRTGWRPQTILEEKPQVRVDAYDAIDKLLKELQHQDLSALYKRDLTSVGNSFKMHLITTGMNVTDIKDIKPSHVQSFLRQFNHSATYYMNKRRTLGAIFSRMVKSKIIGVNPLTETSRLKERSTLHKAYTKEQLKEVLNLLEKEHSNLHLCALVMYGCFLRPHQEIRQLNRGAFSSDLSTISLSGSDNKSGRVRTVFVPPYVKQILIKRGVENLDPRHNLFSKRDVILNESYFNTGWSRFKEKVIKTGLIGKTHTLYSFRHTAAVNLYMKTKDLFKVQQAMGHSSMTVTLTYMRSLGLVNNISAEDVPDL